MQDSIKGVNWAEEVDQENEVPSKSERIDGNKKIVTEYKRVDGKLIKCIRTYRIEKRLVHKVSLVVDWNDFFVFNEFTMKKITEYSLNCDWKTGKMMKIFIIILIREINFETA